MGSLIIVLAFYIAPVHAQASGAGGSNTLDPVEIGAIGFYSHASTFRGYVTMRKCDPADADKIKSINQRLEHVRKRLVARFGQEINTLGKTADWMANGFCDRGTVEAYNMHVTEIEQYMVKNSIK